MSTPLNHKNHKTDRGSTKNAVSSALMPSRFEGDFELSQDGKELIKLHGLHRCNIIVPAGVKVIRANAFDGTGVMSLTLPKGLELFGCGKNKLAWFHYEVRKQNNHPILQTCYRLMLKHVIFYDKKLLRKLQDMVSRKQIPEHVRPFLLRQQSCLQDNIVDLFGVSYCLGGSFLWQFPKGLTRYEIPEGVETLNEDLDKTDLKEVIIPSSLTISYGNLNSARLQTIRFCGNDTHVMHSGNMMNATNLKQIIVPKGTLAHYERQFPQYIGIIIEALW